MWLKPCRGVPVRDAMRLVLPRRRYPIAVRCHAKVTGNIIRGKCYVTKDVTAQLNSAFLIMNLCRTLIQIRSSLQNT